MTVADADFRADASLLRLRALRRNQSWTLAAVSSASVIAGLAMLFRPLADYGPAVNAAGWQFLIWGAIDAVFAAMGVTQSLKADRRPVCPQAEADEFLAAEKLIRALRLNHKLNIGYLAVAGLLLAWAGGAHDAALLGHGIGVLMQGGFLFVLDWVTLNKLTRLMAAPA